MTDETFVRGNDRLEQALADPDTRKRIEMILTGSLADPAWQLHRIAQAHAKDTDLFGVTSGQCLECDTEWPCPTYRWATEPMDPWGLWDE